MTRRLAILQTADAGPVESLAVMLSAVGYDVCIPDPELLRQLRQTYGTRGLVLSPRDLTRGMGYDPLDLPEIGPSGMGHCDLFCDVKAHQVYDLVVKRWPRLKGKVLWYRINGGEPEHVINARGDHGDEIDPPCPVLTPNQWYGVIETSLSQAEPKVNTRYRGVPMKTAERSYCCWPPFARMGEYTSDDRPLEASQYTPPICLIHSVKGWGYHDLVEPVRKLGVKVYGTGSPDGMIPHREAKRLLKTALCMVHLKSSDAPGYALYEALAAGCPVICTGRLIWRCHMDDLLQAGHSCLTFDRRESHDGLTPDQVQMDAGDISYYLECLRNVTFNRKIGAGGRRRLDQVAWSADNPGDVEGFRSWLARNFPL